MSGITSAGIRYPTPSDLLADTALWLRRMGDDVAALLPKGPPISSGLTTVTLNASGDFTLNISTFATLTGAVLEVITANGGNPGTTYIRVHGVNGAGSITGRIHTQQRGTSGYACLALTGNIQLGWIAWGVPK